MATKKERAHQIRIASLPGENTAERVGALLEDMADHQDGVDTSMETLNEELAETNREVAANKDAAAASITYTASTRNIDLKNAKAQVLASANLPLATGSAPGLMSSQGYSRLYGIPNEAILDLGTVSSTDVGDAMAARSEYAGNRKIILIRYDTKGVSALKTTVIIQWCNGINETGQIKFVDKAQWRRNVTGATGVAGAPTNAFRWERTGAHYLGYDAANRKIQLNDYNRTAFRDVQLPLATTSQAGLMAADDKKAVDKIGTIETNVGKLQTTSANRWNYNGSFDVGTTIPVSQFMTKEALRSSLLQPMYIFKGVATSLRYANDMVFRLFSQSDEGVVTFSFALINAEGIERHMLTLNEAGDTWTVTE